MNIQRYFVKYITRLISQLSIKENLKNNLMKFYLFRQKSIPFLFNIPIHGAVVVVKMRKIAIKIQMTPLKNWYMHIGSRLPYLDIIKYTNVYVAISRIPPRANVICLLIVKFGIKSSSIPHTIADVHLE